MMKKCLLLWGLAALLLCSCSPDMKTQDYSRGACSWFNKIRTCKIIYAYIEGTGTRLDIREGRFPSEKRVDINMRLGLSSGKAKVWFQDPDGNKKSVLVEPGAKMDFSGTAAVVSTASGPYFTLYFEPQGSVFWEKPRIENFEIDLNYPTDP